MKFENEVRVGAFFIAASVAGPLLLSPASSSMSTRVAAIGGLIALVGILAIARPVLRVGVFDWMSLTVFSRFPEIQDERLNDPKEKADDAVMQNVFGPILVGIGTLISGFSGYFG